MPLFSDESCNLDLCSSYFRSNSIFEGLIQELGLDESHDSDFLGVVELADVFTKVRLRQKLTNAGVVDLILGFDFLDWC